MNTLFIDTHADFIFLGIYKDNQLINKVEVFEKKDHSTICMPSLVKLLSDSRLTIQEIDDVIVVIGPGSFTGVRIGVTIAKVLAYTLNIPIRTITSLELYTKKVAEGYLVLEEKNGYYVAKKEREKLSGYEYIKKSEWEEWSKTKVIEFCKEIDYNHLATYSHKKEPTMPHIVNPFYVKKIEVEK